MTSSSRSLERTIATFGETRAVQHLGRLDAQIGQVARVQADAHRLVALAPQLLKDPDGIGDAALQGVDGIHQQQAVVGIDVGVGAKGIQLAHAQAHEHLDHAVGVGALGRIAQHVGKAHVGAKIGSTDEGRPRAGIGSLLVPPAQPELQHQTLRDRSRECARPWWR